MLAEDDSNYRSLLSDFLRHRGFTVLEAEDGFQALRLVGVVLPRLLLLDITMPGIDGWDVLEEFRARNLGIPILVLSGAADEARHRALELGARDVLQKPVDLDELVRKIQLLIDEASELPRATESRADSSAK